MCAQLRPNSGAFANTVSNTMTTQLYSVAHRDRYGRISLTQVKAVFELAQRWGFTVYKRHLNSYVQLWCIELDSSASANLIRLQYSEYLTQI